MAHKYIIDGTQLPSVTTILDVLDKPALKQWAANLAVDCLLSQSGTRYDEALKKHVYVLRSEDFEYAKTAWRSVSQEALDIGSEIHNLIEVYLKDGKDAVGKMKPEVENGFLAFLEWEKNNVEEWLRSEHTVYNLNYGYAGTLDAVARLGDGYVYVIDFKSSKGFYDGYDLQLAAYRLAFESMMTDGDKFEIDGMGILRLDKETGMPEWKEYHEYQRKRQAFLALLEYYYKVKKRRLKNNPHVR